MKTRFNAVTADKKEELLMKMIHIVNTVEWGDMALCLLKQTINETIPNFDVTSLKTERRIK